MESGAVGFLAPLLVFGLAVFVLAGFWRVFQKAGKPGWACLVPIYNLVVLLQIARRPVWWLLLMLIPIVNLFVTLVVVVDIARAFGKGVGFGLGLFFLGFVFYPILGFSDARYHYLHAS
jgi:hypothetical protein